MPVQDFHPRSTALLTRTPGCERHAGLPGARRGPGVPGAGSRRAHGAGPCASIRPPGPHRAACRPHSTALHPRWVGRELGLGPGVCEAAIGLGLIRTVAGKDPWERRVPRAEFDRLRADPAAAAALRERARLVGAAAGAGLLGISPARFTRLARLGRFAPADFGLTRYRVVSWRYPAAELLAFAELSPGLLRGRAPEELRRALGRGVDERAARWRARRTARLARHASDPWQRAAVFAAVLEPPALAGAVPSAADRLRLLRLRPPLIAAPVPVGHWDAVRRVLKVTDPREIRRYQERVRGALAEASEDGGLRADPRPSP